MTLTFSSPLYYKHSEKLIPTIILFSHKNKVFKQNLNPNVSIHVTCLRQVFRMLPHTCVMWENVVIFSI